MKKHDMLFKHKLTFLNSSLLIFTTLFFSGCFFWNSDKKVNESKLIVINVLDKDYYDDCHITGSINIPFEDLENNINTMNKKDMYVIYCSNYACTAAPHCAKMMKEAGIENVTVLHAGIVGWYQLKYPYIGEAKMSYLEETNKKLYADEPVDECDNSCINDISAEELKLKMIEAGLLS